MVRVPGDVHPILWGPAPEIGEGEPPLRFHVKLANADALPVY